jgi:hypothetical protein
MAHKLLLFMLIFISATIIGFGQDTFSDDFESGTYIANTGSMNFSGGWTETDESTDPDGGRIRINSNQLRFRNLDSRAIERTLDLSTAISATLTLDYNRTSGSQSVDVQMFNGSAYTTVRTLSNGSTISYSLNPNEMSSNTAIRFVSTGGVDWSGSDIIFVDNIVFSIQFPDQPPVVNATGNQIYCPGSAVSIAQTIDITDPDDTSTSAVYIQISSGYVNGEDLLSLTGSHPNITASWDVVQGELTLQGPTTYTEFEAAVLATEFSSSSPNPSGSRQFSITVGEANFLPVTQHYYEFVSDSGISWTDAEAAAASRMYFGLQGYLVTLTSQEEADFSGAQASGFGWIGATDVAVEGEWRWVTGPETGTQFWQGLSNGTELTFANWNGGEPNNSGGEDYAHTAAASVIRDGAPIGAWNDLPNNGGGGAYASQGYVVEYGGMPGDPVLNISATTSITVDNELPIWVTTSGALNENYECAADVPGLAVCTSLNTTFFNESQFSWGFGLQNTTGTQIDNWEVRILNANYQLNYAQLSNQSAFTYSDTDNGDGTYDLVLTGISPIAPYSGIPGGNIEWPGVNFGFNPDSDGITRFCGSVTFIPPVAIDNCGGITVTEVSDAITINNGTNDFVRVITYEATDTSGNTSLPFTKTITVQDTTTPTASNPATINVFCASDVPAPDILVVTDETDNCSETPIVTYIGDTTDGGTNPETITRTYRVSDLTGNISDVTQTILVFNFLISSQPAGISTVAGTSVSFSVTASNTNSYQWQVSMDAGATFNDISNGTEYTGVQSTNLVLSVAAVSTSKNGHIYRVLVSNSASVCPVFVSDSALLTIRSGTVITNRRITYRVRNN